MLTSTTDFSKRPNWHYDITRSLESAKPKTQVKVTTTDANTTSFLDASFVFKKDQGKAGQNILAQLSIRSNAHEAAAPIVPRQLQISFEGSIKTIVLRHDADLGGEAPSKKGPKVAICTVPLAESVARGTEEGTMAEGSDEKSVLTGKANLTLTPGATMVLEMEIPLREPGDSRAEAVKVFVETAEFELEHTCVLREATNTNIWFLSPLTQKKVVHADPLAVQILPRPPKMDIRDVVLMDQYYTNETIDLVFEVLNAEDVEAIVKIDVVLFGEETPEFALKLAGSETHGGSTVENEERRLLGVPVGTVESSKSIRVGVQVKPVNQSNRYDLTLRATYHLSTDPQTPITQTGVFFLNVVNPFEANYDLLPRLHPDPWPCLFDSENVQDLSGDDDALDVPRGISQTWCLITRYASFASEDLQVMDLDISIQQASPAVRCSIKKQFVLPEQGRKASPQTIGEAAFDVVAQKRLLDDRSQSSLDVSFIIKWRRIANQDDEETARVVNTTTLPVPRFNIFGIEPRVLASVSYLPLHQEGQRGSPVALVLTISIENASNHFLTFGLTMESSDEFAFSGAKQTTVHLLPVSRRSVRYRLLPLVRGGTWIRPGLVVRDKYFQKVLRVIPTEGMKMDKDGFTVWIPPEDGEDEAQVDNGVEKEADDEEASAA
jgi:hypothetical protein